MGGSATAWAGFLGIVLGWAVVAHLVIRDFRKAVLITMITASFTFETVAPKRRLGYADPFDSMVVQAIVSALVGAAVGALVRTIRHHPPKA